MNSCPEKIIMQWHITERCNLSCRHCYREDVSSKDPDIEELIMVLESFISFLKNYWMIHRKTKGHINIAGGEPLSRNDFYELVSILSSRQSLFSLGILTNGTMINADMARFLSKNRISFVQVSLDGMEETHDRLRGDGNFRKVTNAIKTIVNAGIRTFVSFTANRMNYMEFPELARYCSKLGVSRLWADRMLPMGSGAMIGSTCLNPSETCDFIKIMAESRKKSSRFFRSGTEITLNRSLQFHSGGGYPYRCRAGDTIFAVMPDSSVYPCRRMPVPVGNLRDESLAEIYACDFFESLRDKKKVIQGCEKCFYRSLCQGGLRCLSHAVKGSPFHKDPGCWL